MFTVRFKVCNFQTIRYKNLSSVLSWQNALCFCVDLKERTLAALVYFVMFRRNGRVTVALNLQVTFLKCRANHTGPGYARSGGIVIHRKKTCPNNGSMPRQANRQQRLGQLSAPDQ
ncbi:hypothetical protein T10_213 [Trichinella papuae]|uniref:Uncharacterized protein n=1 Tax=Trichinella papuae TaxID=268474 RepID=A0A0V1MRY4_9BILA|nr:hypothetical protein T10_213 [Trichinella papuae]